MILTGNLKNSKDFDTSEGEGMTLGQAFSVLFCCAFGAGVAFQGWYPQLAGLYGYPLMIVIVGLSAATAGNALFETAMISGAQSFAELTQALPSFTRKVTPWCSIVWNFVIVGLYIQFVFTFFNDQVLARYDASVPAQGSGALPLYGAVGVMVFFVCLPPGLGGEVMKCITLMNTATTWVVIITAIAKGIHTIYTSEPADRPQEYVTFRPAGLLQVLVLLAGAMFQVVPVPRLNHEMKPHLRERGSWVLPYGLALLQGSIFCLVGTVGYLALGSAIPSNGDVFAAYFAKRPDFMTTILQGGIALLMFFSTPIFAVIGKSELWGQISAPDADGNPIPFESSPFMARLFLNLGMTLTFTLWPMSVGRTMYMNVFIIANGTVAVWMNLCLPAFVIGWVQVLPKKRRGEPWLVPALKTGWIVLLALLMFYSSAQKIVSIFVPSE